MGSVAELQSLLASIPGVTAAYFQAPESQKMTYPCIRFKLSNIVPSFANNKPYNLANMYTITVMDTNPLTQIPYLVAALEGCIFDRHYTSDNLHHYIFNIHF